MTWPEMHWLELGWCAVCDVPRQVRMSCRGRDTTDSMEISGTHKFTANRQAVWDALHDSAVLKKSIPGAEEVIWQSDGTITARIHIGIGPINGTYGGRIQVVEQTAPSHLKLAINRNAIQAEATVELADDGSGTVATYQGTAKLQGPLAVADNIVGKQMAQGALGQFFKNFEQHIG